MPKEPAQFQRDTTHRLVHPGSYISSCDHRIVRPKSYTSTRLGGYASGYLTLLSGLYIRKVVVHQLVPNYAHLSLVRNILPSGFASVERYEKVERLIDYSI